MKDLKERVVRGGLAKICAQAVTFTLRVGSLMVLARLLEPKDFGLVGMVTAFTGVLYLFRDFGLSTATVQRVNVTEDQISTLFWINILVGAILWLSLTLAAPFVVSFYHEPNLFWVTVILATGFLFNAAGVQHAALLERQMRFTALAAIDVISIAVSIAISIILAAAGFGYWALVTMSITPPFVMTVGFWLTTSWIPGKPSKQAQIRSLIHFGGTITLNGVVTYIAYNLEKVLLGRFWGPEALGIYGRSYQLISIPTENLNAAVGGIAFSALSRVQDDPPRFKNYFLKGYSLTLALTLPATIAVALFAKDIILVLLGPKWKDSTVIFQLLAPTIVIFALINPLSWLLMSLGLVRRSLNIAFVLAPLLIAGYVVGLPFGPRGVALGYSAVLTLWVIPHIAWCVRDTVISVRDILVAVSRPLISGVVAAASAFGLQFAYSQMISPLPRLLLGITILFGVYAAMLLYAMGQKTTYINLLQGLNKPSSVDEKALAPV
jgi:PST family polysaccharide transporter